jgi:hypothetical protein
MLLFGQCQTQIGDIVKTIGPIELHHVGVDQPSMPIPTSPKTTTSELPPGLRRATGRIVIVVIPPISGPSPGTADRQRILHLASAGQYRTS